MLQHISDMVSEPAVVNSSLIAPKKQECWWNRSIKLVVVNLVKHSFNCDLNLFLHLNV